MLTDDSKPLQVLLADNSSQSEYVAHARAAATGGLGLSNSTPRDFALPDLLNAACPPFCHVPGFDGLVAIEEGKSPNSQHRHWDGPRKVLIHKTLRFTASALISERRSPEQPQLSLQEVPGLDKRVPRVRKCRAP
jgi:hypothetical protein